MSTTYYFNQINGRISDDGKIVRGVSVITEGQAKGHDLHIDSKTLQTLFEAATSEKGGRVKTKLNHRGANGQTAGIEAVFGYLSEFRIEGPKLLADLHLLKSHKDYDQTIEQIREMPEHIGLSVAFSGKPEVIDGKKFARAESIISTDLVPEPAANPTGMFEEGPLLGTDEVDTLNKDNKMDALEEILNKLNGIEERLGAQEEAIESLYDAPEGAENEEIVTDEEIDEAIEALREQGFEDHQIEEILSEEIDAIYDEVEGEDEGEEQEDEVDARSIDQGAQGSPGQQATEYAPAMAGVDGLDDGSAEGEAFSRLTGIVNELQSRLDNQEAEAEAAELDARFASIQDRIAELGAANETLKAENEAYKTALETGGELTGLAPSAEVELSTGEGRFEQIVQVHLSEGKTHSEAIQLAAKDDKRAHTEWLQRRGVLPEDVNIQA
tara:strand:+ start:10321 stop:11640 length:1320 start_codon:yes stop_codon:yes gene_type:complete